MYSFFRRSLVRWLCLLSCARDGGSYHTSTLSTEICLKCLTPKCGNTWPVANMNYSAQNQVNFASHFGKQVSPFFPSLHVSPPSWILFSHSFFLVLLFADLQGSNANFCQNVVWLGDWERRVGGVETRFDFWHPYYLHKNQLLKGARNATILDDPPIKKTPKSVFQWRKVNWNNNVLYIDCPNYLVTHFIGKGFMTG